MGNDFNKSYDFPYKSGNFTKKNSIDKKSGKKIKLVDVYTYDKNKWKGMQLTNEKALRSLLQRKDTTNYLNEILGDWGLK